MDHFNQGSANFGAPGQNMRMMAPGGPPHFHNRPCPWGPLAQQMQRPRFNISHFMHPPHSMVSDIFSTNPRDGPHSENISFNNQQGQPQNVNGNFRGRGGHGRGFARGNRGGLGFRGGFRGGINGSQPQNRQKGKKEKVNKRELPENNAFFCDSCDRGFKTEEKFKEHTDGHMKCTFKDCSYIAAPKLVHLHMNMQHRSGLAKKIWGLESEADVVKWREERKRNYPTAENIARRKEEMEAKIARGEVLETKDFSKIRGRGHNHRGRGHDRGRGRGRRGRGRWRDYDRMQEDHTGSRKKKEDSDDNDDPPEEVPMSRSARQDDPEQTTAPMTSAETPALPPDQPVRPALGSLALLTSYGGSSSSDTDSDTDGDNPDDDQASQNSVPITEIKSAEMDNTISTSLSSSSSSSSSASMQQAKPERLPNPFSPPPSTSTTVIATSEGETSRDMHSTQKNAAQNDVLHNKHKEVKDGEKESSPKKSPVQKDKSPRKHTSHFDDGSSQTGQEDDGVDSHGTGGDSTEKRSPKGKNVGGSKRKGDYDQNGNPAFKRMKGRQSHPVRKYTLLEKLLAPDIRRERNKILQCVHYIVKHRFFEGDLEAGQQATTCTPAVETSASQVSST